MDWTALTGEDPDHNIIFRKNRLVKPFLTKKFAKVMYLRFSGCQRDPDWAQNSRVILVEDRPGQTRVSDRMRPSANS